MTLAAEAGVNLKIEACVRWHSLIAGIARRIDDFASKYEWNHQLSIPCSKTERS